MVSEEFCYRTKDESCRNTWCISKLSSYSTGAKEPLFHKKDLSKDD